MNMLFSLMVSALCLFAPGDTVPDRYVASNGADAFFTVSEVPDSVFVLMKGRTFGPDCNLPLSELRYLRCLHKDIDGRTKVGEMVLNRRIADDVLDILRKLYDASYPIERMRLPDYWDADDERQMRDNNSSSFNFRFVAGTKVISKHGKGMAVDINPLYNPYHKFRKDGTEVVEPSNAGGYVDRNGKFPYKIVKGDLCWKLFTQHGFEWGGAWKSCKDYQHFEMPE